MFFELNKSSHHLIVETKKNEFDENRRDERVTKSKIKYIIYHKIKIIANEHKRNKKKFECCFMNLTHLR